MEFLFDHFWLEILLMLLGITAVAFFASRFHVPTAAALRLPINPEDLPEPRDRAEQELQALGFRYLGDFDITTSKIASGIMRVYLSPDGYSVANLMDVKTFNTAVTVPEFVSDLEPEGNLNTNTSGNPGIFVYPPTKMVIRAPWKKTIHSLFELHVSLCAEIPDGFQFKLLDPLHCDYTGTLQDESRKDFESQVKHGRMRRINDRTYAFTLKGIAIAVPLLWLNLSYGILFSWYRPSDDILRKRVRQRYEKARNSLRHH